MAIKVQGIGLTPFGELWERSFEDLLKESVNNALKDANINIEDIDKVFIGSMLSGETCSQSNLGGLFSELFGVQIPVVRVEAACASGGVAVYEAVQNLQSGAYNRVLVAGIEKMTDFPADVVMHMLMQAASEEERMSGATFPSLYAMLAQAHMDAFGTTREQMALASVLAHKHGARNNLAQFRREITVQDVLAGTPVADPLCLLDCSPITDGAACVILSNDAPIFGAKEAFVLAQSMATDSVSLSARKSLTELAATKIAAQKLFSDSGLQVKQVDVVELHDCFSIAGLLAFEDIGFVEKGKGGSAFERMMKGDDGLPTYNPSGGLKACGHPVGATGVKQLAEIALQIRNAAGRRQVTNASLGLTQNIGGSGATCIMQLIGSTDFL